MPDRPDLRPTGDRVRETLFNWLAPVLPGSRCLDAFAGTGALSLEAASRGASRVLAVERDRELAVALRRAASEWGAGALEVVNGDVRSLLAGPSEPFDIVFLDAPFGGSDLPEVLSRLDPEWLAPRALVYIESDAEVVPEVPGNWELHRESRAGQVAFRLYRAGTGS